MVTSRPAPRAGSLLFLTLTLGRDRVVARLRFLRLYGRLVERLLMVLLDFSLALRLRGGDLRLLAVLLLFLFRELRLALLLRFHGVLHRDVLTRLRFAVGLARRLFLSARLFDDLALLFGKRTLLRRRCFCRCARRRRADNRGSFPSRRQRRDRSGGRRRRRGC